MELHIEREINAPASVVWDLLGAQFADIDAWSSMVDASRTMLEDEVPEGMTIAPTAPVVGRETTSALATAQEVLVHFSDLHRELTFAVIGLPPFIRRAQNAQRVRPLNANCSLVSFDIEMVPIGPFKLLSPLMRRKLASGMARVLADLAGAAEAVRAT